MWHIFVSYLFVGVVTHQPVGIISKESNNNKTRSDKYDAINIIGSVNLIQSMLCISVAYI